MYQLTTLGHEDAKRAIDAITAELKALNAPAVIAVVDLTGELVALLRLDGSPLACIANASHKAFTAAREAKPSREVGQASRHPITGFDLRNYADKRYIGWGGGVPVCINGKVVGAVAVSGLSESEDERLAALGATAIYSGAAVTADCSPPL